MQNPRSETRAALEAVRRGLAVAKQRVDATHIQSKGGVDIVTGADIAAEKVIRQTLLEHCPDIPVVGEEGEDAPPATGAYWLVDPICGTRNYASHLAVYCTNVALVEDGRATLSVIGDGGTSELYFAERGKGAFHALGLDSAAAHERICARDGSVIGLELGGKPPYRDPALAQLFSAIASDGRFYPRLLGTTLDFVKVACGDMAALVLLTDAADPLHTAAGCLLAEEAGARVTDRAGHPWSLESTTRIAAATQELHAELAALVR
jgi:myo-inositol-1(or 4)-monophosphatase